MTAFEVIDRADAPKARAPLIAKSGKSAEVRAYILKHYPCQAIPHGDLTIVGNRFGVTRELVRQIALLLNMGHMAKLKPTYLCICGKQTRTPNAVCYDCRKVTLACEACGEPVIRSAAALAQRQGRQNRTPSGSATYSGRVFCNHSCHAAWMGHQNKGRARPDLRRRGEPMTDRP